MEWQPIETAPKDGTEIDVWAKNAQGSQRRITDVAWSRMGDWDGTEFDGWTGMYPDRFGTKYEPTHWQPLPEPPSQSHTDYAPSSVPSQLVPSR